MEQLILNKAKDLFFSYGFKSVSMDDLAKMAGVSKKTIYQSVSDKTELVEKVADELIRCHAEQLTQSAEDATDAVQEVSLQLNTSFTIVSSVNYNFFYELEKFFPSAWKKLIDHRNKTLLPAIIKNLRKGIVEDNYREDIDPAFVAQIRLQQMSTALNPIRFSEKKLDTQKLMHDLTIFYLHGIVSTKGKKLINKYFKEQ